MKGAASNRLGFDGRIRDRLCVTSIRRNNEDKDTIPQGPRDATRTDGCRLTVQHLKFPPSERMRLLRQQPVLPISRRSRPREISHFLNFHGDPHGEGVGKFKKIPYVGEIENSFKTRFRRDKAWSSGSFFLFCWIKNRNQLSWKSTKHVSTFFFVR